MKLNDMSEKPNIVSQLLCNLDAFLVQELVATLVPTKFFFIEKLSEAMIWLENF